MMTTGMRDDENGENYLTKNSWYLLGGKAMSKTAAAVNKVMCEALSG